MTWQDEQKQVATGVTDGTDGRKYSTVFPYEPKPRPIRVEDDDDIQDYKRPWVGLTDEERISIRERVQQYTRIDSWQYGFALQVATEQALKEKNA